MKTLCIFDKGTDPYWNLAAEEYLLKEFDQPVFRLWRNDNAIIVGCNQNTMAEIDAQFVKEHGIKVVRRLSGGGAVFHDLGNLNYTFIEHRRYAAGATGTKDESETPAAPSTSCAPRFENPAEMFRRFTAPVIEALNSIGVPAYLQGRNDLLIDGRKFSGNAVCIWHNRALQHGTLLFESNVSNLSGALKTRPEKFTGKSVASNRQRVTNISTYLPGGSGINGVQEFGEYLMHYITHHPNNNSNSNCTPHRTASNDYKCQTAAESNRTTAGRSNVMEYEPYEYSAEDIAAINRLADEKYSREWWNYGKSPKYTFRNVRKFPWGLVEVCFNVANGRISDLHIFGDYFSLRPTSELEAALEGTLHSVGEIERTLLALPHNINSYFSQLPLNAAETESVDLKEFSQMFY